MSVYLRGWVIIQELLFCCVLLPSYHGETTKEEHCYYCQGVFFFSWHFFFRDTTPLFIIPFRFIRPNKQTCGKPRKTRIRLVPDLGLHLWPHPSWHGHWKVKLVKRQIWWCHHTRVPTLCYERTGYREDDGSTGAVTNADSPWPLWGSAKNYDFGEEGKRVLQEWWDSTNPQRLTSSVESHKSDSQIKFQRVPSQILFWDWDSLVYTNSTSVRLVGSLPIFIQGKWVPISTVPNSLVHTVRQIWLLLFCWWERGSGAFRGWGQGDRSCPGS
jgi:hypothetical protein